MECSGRVPSSLLSCPSLLSWEGILEPWGEESCQTFASLNLDDLEGHQGHQNWKSPFSSQLG